VATYDYQDAPGKLLFQVCRLEPKSFRQRRPDRKGGWVWNMARAQLVPYRLPGLLKANCIFIVEGEKDADRLVALGLAATCNPGGAGKWRKDFGRYFQGKAVIILPDNDPPGKTHAQYVARSLHGIAASVKVAELPGLPLKGDVSDWLKAGGAVEQLKALVEAASEWQPPPVKPDIIVTGQFLQEKSSQALQALETANSPAFIFRRAGTLARVCEDENRVAHIKNLSDIALRGILARAANFFKEGKKGVAPTSPPMEIPRDILALGEWPAFPALDGLAMCPILRPDGSLFSLPGYDSDTRLFNVTPPDLVPAIPDRPTTEDVKISLGYLLEIVQDFPFFEDSDRANALALMCTLPLRPAIPGNVPMAAITAPAPGTGKTLLADVVALIGTGKVGPMGGVSGDDDELRKAITARLLYGDPIICLDNVEGPLRSPSLSRALTSVIWQDRLLGQSATVRLPQRAVWIATGNNLQLRGDLPRRTFPIRLDARLAKPWERQNFKHPGLRDWVLCYRGDLLAAILTLARAWFVAGKPEPEKSLPVMGGFDDWVNIIGGILSFAGIPGFLQNLKAFHDQADLEGPEWEGFLNAWIEVVGEQGKTCQELTAMLRDNSEFVATLPDNLQDVLKDPERSFERSLGRALARKEKRPFGENNLALQRIINQRKLTLWTVSPLK